MRVIEQEVKLFPTDPYQSILFDLMVAGRTSYQSYKPYHEYSLEENEAFIRKLIKKGHESVLEHSGVTAHLVTDRGVSHELVRHRLASYTQESTRYCNYEKGITVVRPVGFKPNSPAYKVWYQSCLSAEKAYKDLLQQGGVSPQEARSILPTCLKTSIVVTANYREWRHILKLRLSPQAHPQMRTLMSSLFVALYQTAPIIFEDLKEASAQ